MKMDLDIDEDDVAPCRTCGVYYMKNSNFLRPLCPTNDSEIENVDNHILFYIRLELAAWNTPIHENDGLPQHICNSCIHEFSGFFKFRRSCVDLQVQLCQLRDLRNNIISMPIKSEIKIEPEEYRPDEDGFIYIDSLSDDEQENVSTTFPHVSIKIEKKEDEEDSQPCYPAATETHSRDEPIIEQQQVQKVENVVTDTKIAVMSNGLKDEEEKVSESKNEISCKSCSYIFSNAKEYRSHYQLVHQIIESKTCHTCGKVFENITKSRFKFHMRYHKINKHVKCTLCGFICSSTKALKEHKNAKHKKVTCNVCDKSILPQEIQTHMQKHNQDLTISKVKTLVNEANHQLPSLLKKRVLTPEPEEPTNSSFDEHRVIFWEDKNELNVQNNDCDSVSSEQTDDVIVKCDESEYSEENYSSSDISSDCLSPPIYTSTSVTFNDLQAPIVVDIKKKPAFECQICQKAFQLKFHLNRHLKQHNTG